MCLRRAFQMNDTLGKTIVIMTDNMPLALAITKGRASSSHLIQSCRFLCGYSLFCNIAMQASWIAASESKHAGAPIEERITTQSQSRDKLCPCTAHLGKPLSTGGQSLARSDASELNQEHLDLLDMAAFDIATTTTSRHHRLPLSGLLRPRVPARPRIRHGSHVVIGDQTLRAPFRSKRRTDPPTLTQSSPRVEEPHPSHARPPVPIVGMMAWWEPASMPT